MQGEKNTYAENIFSSLLEYSRLLRRQTTVLNFIIFHFSGWPVILQHTNNTQFTLNVGSVL